MGKVVAVAFIDCKKAFDCVQRAQLLIKLQRKLESQAHCTTGGKAILAIDFSALSLMTSSRKCNQSQWES